MSLTIVNPATRLRLTRREVDSCLEQLLDMFDYLTFAKLRSYVEIGLQADHLNDGSPVVIRTAAGQSGVNNALINGTLTRVYLYLTAYADIIQDADSLLNFFKTLHRCPKPWSHRTVTRAFPAKPPQVNPRQVRDFNLGNLVGGHAVEQQPANRISHMTLIELENFSSELVILESLLPLYLENTI